MNDFSRKFSNNIWTIGFIFLFFTAANFTQKSIDKPILKISKQDSAFNLDLTIVDIFSLGYRRFITSLLWISTILESDHEHYRGKDTNSWMFLRFNLIAKLDPLFYENYAFGGQYLSIIKDDDIGAKIIFDKGLIHFPNDYDLLSNAAFHYHFELNDYENSSRLYQQLIKLPQTPRHVITLYARIISTNGTLEEAYNILSELYEKNKHIEFFKKRYLENLYSIKAEIDLNCLNKIKKNCQEIDLYGQPYIYRGNNFEAKTPWTKFKIKTKFNK